VIDKKLRDAVLSADGYLMRIVYLGINYWPDETGIAPFATGRCEYLASRGHEVIALTAPPYYPQWSIPRGYRGRLVRRQQRNGVTILRSWLYVPRQQSAARRIMHEASFIASSFANAAVRTRPDIMFVTSPPLGLATSAIVLSRLWSVPYVFHVADLQPDAALNLGMLHQGPITHALYRLEAAAYRNAALVSTLTEKMRHRIVANGAPAERVALFSDWVEPRLFELSPPTASAVPGELLVAHFGNMGVKQGLDVVLDAARITASNRRIRYLLVGDGAARPALQAKAAAMGVSNVEFLPLQPHDRFLELLASAGLCLVTQQASVADIVFPSKVLTLLAAARPLLVSVSAASEVARVVSEAGAGMVVSPEDAGVLASAITSLWQSPGLLAAMGDAGRAYAAAHWQREAVLERLEASLVAIARREFNTAQLLGGAASQHQTQV
jgi:colanic acid biosynthesis glycosyl transferase WcaI